MEMLYRQRSNLQERVARNPNSNAAGLLEKVERQVASREAYLAGPEYAASQAKKVAKQAATNARNEAGPSAAVPVSTASPAGGSVLDQFGGSTKLAIAGGVAAGAIGLTAGGIAFARSRSGPKRRKSQGRSRRRGRSGGQRSSRRRGVRRTGSARAYRRPGGKRVVYIKRADGGRQPAIRLASGKLRFIKKRGLS